MTMTERLRWASWPGQPEVPQGLKGLLSCGHWSGTSHAASSTWDFPLDLQWCPSCQDERYFDITLQAELITANESSPE